MADCVGAAASVENRDEALFITSLNLPKNQRLELISSKMYELSLTFEGPELQSLQERLEDSFTQKNELPEELSSKEDEINELEESVGELQKDVRRKEDEREERESELAMAAPIRYGPSGSTKGPYVEPHNCTKIGDVSLPNQTDAEQAAKDYCLKNPAQNCCTIKGGVVTKWSLPSRFDTVKLKSAATGVYFVSHIDLDVEW